MGRKLVRRGVWWVAALGAVGCAGPSGNVDGTGRAVSAIQNGTPVSNSDNTGHVVIGGCSGTLLAERWVLTARHCIDTEPDDTLAQYNPGPNPVQTAVDSTNRIRTIGSWALPGARLRDAALARLENPLTLSGTALPRPLYRQPGASLIGKTVSCFGWSTGNLSQSFNVVGAVDPIGRIRVDFNALNQGAVAGDSGGTCMYEGQVIGTHSVNWGSSWGMDGFERIGPWIDRIVYAPRPDDFSGDARSDLLWRDVASGDVFTWEIDARIYTTPITAQATRRMIRAGESLDWRLVGAGDFDGNGASDLLWRHATTGDVSVWFMNGTSLVRTEVVPAGTAWSLRGTGDFNDDGTTDLVWVNTSTRQVSYWQWRSTGVTTSPLFSYSDSSWGVAGVGDFDKDGASDVLWRHSTTGELSVWRSGVASGALTSVTYLAVGDADYWASRSSSYALRAVGDFNGDGDPDLLWQAVSTGAVTVDFMRDLKLFQSATLNSSQDLAWSLQSVGDYDMNGQDDVVWLHTGSRQVSMWLASGFNVGPLTEVEEFDQNLDFQFSYMIVGGATAGPNDAIVRTEF